MDHPGPIEWARVASADSDYSDGTRWALPRFKRLCCSSLEGNPRRRGEPLFMEWVSLNKVAGASPLLGVAIVTILLIGVVRPF
jgi:hypothetical protein